MKQAELDKLLNAVAKQSALAHNWNYSRGFVFKSTEILFFSIVILGRLKQRELSYSLYYKWLAFDDLFWKIVNLQENQKKPLSFRACGAWTAPMTTTDQGTLSVADWNTDHVAPRIDEIIGHYDSQAESVASQVHGLDDNLRLIESTHARLKERYPNAVTNTWRERLLTSILKGDYQCAQRIIKDRISSRDFGGFQSGSKTFYEMAGEYIRTLV